MRKRWTGIVAGLAAMGAGACQARYPLVVENHAGRSVRVVAEGVGGWEARVEAGGRHEATLRARRGGEEARVRFGLEGSEARVSAALEAGRVNHFETRVVNGGLVVEHRTREESEDRDER